MLCKFLDNSNALDSGLYTLIIVKGHFKAIMISISTYIIMKMTEVMLKFLLKKFNERQKTFIFD